MTIKTLYHGSIHSFDEVYVSKGKGYKDFGKGFYLSGNKQSAERMARRNREGQLDRLRGAGGNDAVNAYLYEFTLDMDLLPNYNPCVFPQVDIKWLDFILDNRKCATRTHIFGSVIGATADDWTDVCLRAYYAGVYGPVGSENAKIRLIEMFEPDKLPIQYYIGNQELAEKLVRVGKVVLA